MNIIEKQKKQALQTRNILGEDGITALYALARNCLWYGYDRLFFMEQYPLARKFPELATQIWVEVSDKMAADF